MILPRPGPMQPHQELLLGLTYHLYRSTRFISLDDNRAKTCSSLRGRRNSIWLILVRFLSIDFETAKSVTRQSTI
jgi:hypothetical protein